MEINESIHFHFGYGKLGLGLICDLSKNPDKIVIINKSPKFIKNIEIIKNETERKKINIDHIYSIYDLSLINKIERLFKNKNKIIVTTAVRKNGLSTVATVIFNIITRLFVNYQQYEEKGITEIDLYVLAFENVENASSEIVNYIRDLWNKFGKIENTIFNEILIEGQNKNHFTHNRYSYITLQSITKNLKINVVPVEIIADRICSKMYIKMNNNGEFRVIVNAEDYCEILYFPKVVYVNQRTIDIKKDVLETIFYNKECFEGLEPGCLEVSYIRKFVGINGLHMLIAHFCYDTQQQSMNDTTLSDIVDNNQEKIEEMKIELSNLLSSFDEKRCFKHDDYFEYLTNFLERIKNVEDKCSRIIKRINVDPALSENLRKYNERILRIANLLSVRYQRIADELNRHGNLLERIKDLFEVMYIE